MTTLSPEKPTTQPRLNYPKVVPTGFQAMRELYQVARRSGLDKALLLLVDIRASQINGCAFCLEMHIREARAAGESEDRINLIAAWRDVDIYTERECAAFEWTETLTRLAEGHVSEGDFAAAREVFTETELASLTFAIVAINGWNRLNVGFRMPPRFAG